MSHLGETFQPELDFPRITSLRDRVRHFMLDGQWHTLRQVREACGGSEAGVSARLRDLRKWEYGHHTVERRRAGDPTRGLHEYRLVLR